MQRDMDIIRTIGKFQCLRTEQICRLFFPSLKVAQRRLRMLSKYDCIKALPVANIRPGKPEYLYYLSDKGAEMFNISASKPRFTRQLSHQQKNTELLIDIELSFRDTKIDYKVLPEHLIRIAGQQSLISDGAFTLSRDKNTVLFMLENDCATEPLISAFHNDLEAKIAKYIEMFKNNQIKMYNLFFRAEFNRFQLLFVASNFSRMKAVSRLIEKYDEHGFMLLTTLHDFQKSGVKGNIWNIPAKNKFKTSII